MLKNITLSADESLVQRARARAAMEKRTLNAAFREWLARYAGKDRDLESFKSLMQKLEYVDRGNNGKGN